VSVAAASRLGRQLEEVIASLSRLNARFALIGGLALASHKVIRATQDIDLLTDSEKAEDIDRELIAIGSSRRYVLFGRIARYSLLLTDSCSKFSYRALIYRHPGEIFTS
jgi:hypothetical protein